MNFDHLKVGDTVCYLRQNYSRHTTFEPVTITKVGRVWITFKSHHREYRFDKKTGYVDGRGYSSPGRIYLTDTEYYAECAHEKRVEKIRKMIARASSLTFEQSKQIAQILGLSEAQPNE